jgi:hypothetical protein
MGIIHLEKNSTVIARSPALRGKAIPGFGAAGHESRDCFAPLAMRGLALNSGRIPRIPGTAYLILHKRGVHHT